MGTTISKIILIIGALSAIGMIYLLVTEETSKLFYILMLITLSTGALNQYIRRKSKKNTDSETNDL